MSIHTPNDNPRAARSRAALIAATVELLDERELADVSITDICRRAAVSRPTFYLHFGDAATVVQAAALLRLQGLFPAQKDSTTLHSRAALEQFLDALLQGLAEHAAFYRRVVAGPSGVAFHASVVDFVTERLGAADGAAGAGRTREHDEFLAAGATWLVVRAITGGPLTPRALHATAAAVAGYLDAAGAIHAEAGR